MTSPQIDPSAQPSLSDAINKLMANPEIISMVASTLGNLNTPKPESAAEPPKAEEVSVETDTSETSALPAPNSAGAPDLGELIKGIAPMMSRLNGGEKRSSPSCEADRREALLCALKPYVSDGRREAIDYIIRISQVSDILKGIQNRP